MCSLDLPYTNGKMCTPEGDKVLSDKLLAKIALLMEGCPSPRQREHQPSCELQGNRVKVKTTTAS